MSRRSAAAFCVVFSCTEYRLSALPFTASNSTTATEPSAAVITITTPKLAYSFLRTDRFRRRFLMAGLSRRRWGEAGRTARVIATARRQLRGVQPITPIRGAVYVELGGARPRRGTGITCCLAATRRE